MSSGETRNADHGRGIWIFILIITGVLSLFLNIWHAVTIPPEPVEGVPGPPPDDAPDWGRIVLGVILGAHPVLMAAFLSHTFIKRTPAPVRAVVVLLFLVGMGMSMTAQVEVLIPVAGHVARAIGLVLLVDIPALLSLYMLSWIERERAVAAPTRPVEAVAEKPVESVARPVTSTGRRPVADRSPEESRPVTRPVADRSPEESRPVARPVAETTADRSPEESRPVARPVAETTADRSPQRSPQRSPKRPTAETGLSTRDRARLLLAEDPQMSGAEIARKLGISPERGRTLRREILAEGTPSEGGAVVPLRAVGR